MKDILVIGESCRDIFVYCEACRLCPDIPVPVVTILNQTENPGMAKNVQRNIHSLNVECDIITNDNWYSVTKTRYMHEQTNHMFIRIDSDHNIKRLNITDIDLNYKIIVISDYNKGFLAEDDIQTICKKHNNVFLDTKKILGEWAEEARYIKINNYEYINSKPYLTQKLKEKVIHTQGGDGCSLNNIKYPVTRVEVKDSSGAGDSFISGLVCNFLQTEDIDSAIKYANKCASEVVQHRGVTVIT